MTRREAWITGLGALFLSGCDKLRQASSQPGSTQAPQEPAQTPELQLDYSIVIDGSSAKRVNEKYRFRSGDRFQLEFRPAFPAFVYLVNRGSGQNEYAFLYPNQRISRGNPLEVNQTVTLPGGNDWYTLDDRAGVENIILIASAEPISEFAGAPPSIGRDTFEEKLALLERDRQPRSSRRFEEGDWTKLFATHDDHAVIVQRLPIDHR